VGVCSYLLVHFWYTRVAAVKSALNAMFTNRVGDYFLTVGFFALFYTFMTLDYALIFSLAHDINPNVITFIAILLLLGAAAKSAQLGLHGWLPMAMEGPTPVSSLIHAATMVTAGVYLLVRCSPLIEQSEAALTIILVVGAVTAFFAASIGLFQNDIKKVIAFSTMSQLAPHFKNVNQTVCEKFIISKDITFNSQIIKTYKKRVISILISITEAIRLILINNKIFLLISRRTFCSWIFNLMHWLNFNILYLSNIEKGRVFYNDINSLSSNNEKSLNCKIINKINEDPWLKFNEWLAGLIDGDGYFILTKKGYVSCEITMDLRDGSILYLVQEKYGGSITRVSKANALKYKLWTKNGLINLINGINGLVRNPVRLLQLNKLCQKYNISLKQPMPLTFNNGWLSGFIDSDGSIYLNEKSGQVFISITQKNKDMLDPLVNLFGGKIYSLSSNNPAFK